MEKRKIVIHTLGSDLEEANSKKTVPVDTNPRLEVGSNINLNKSKENLIKIKKADYSTLYFSFVAFAFLMIIALLGYFLYLDYKENVVRISVAVEQETVKTIDIKSIWPESGEASGLMETIQNDNYLLIRVNNFDNAFRFYTYNQMIIKEFAENIFSLSNLKASDDIEIENIKLKSFSNGGDTVVYGFYFDRTLIIAKSVEAFKSALQDKDLNKL